MSAIRLTTSGTKTLVPLSECFLKTAGQNTTLVLTSTGLALLLFDSESKDENALASQLVRTEDRPIVGDVELYCYDVEGVKKQNASLNILSIGTSTYANLLDYYGFQAQVKKNTQAKSMVKFHWTDLGENSYSVTLPAGVEDCAIIARTPVPRQEQVCVAKRVVGGHQSGVLTSEEFNP